MGQRKAGEGPASPQGPFVEPEEGQAAKENRELASRGLGRWYPRSGEWPRGPNSTKRTSQRRPSTARPPSVA